MRGATIFVVTFVLTVALLPANPADAFYEAQNQDGQLTALGFVRLTGSAYQSPDDPALYPNRTFAEAGTVARLLVNGKAGEGFHFEFNAYNLLNYTTVEGGGGGEIVQQTERSPALRLDYTGEGRATGQLAVDRLSATLTRGRVGVTIGRRPVNLATCLVFTPNDLFAPFSAQDFYRVYKAGVDSASMEVRMGAVSQFTVIGVLGYRPDTGRPGRFDNAVSWERTSVLARAGTVLMGVEWTALAGRVRGATIGGGSAQGEFFNNWLNVRAEGHYAKPENAGKPAYTEFALELEHVYKKDFTLWVAWFHHGSGNARTDEYASALAGGDSFANAYLGREYLGGGIGWQATPLLDIQLLGVVNLNDRSSLLATALTWSLTNEAELYISALAPWGSAPDRFDIRSEYGAYPYSASAELRVYF